MCALLIRDGESHWWNSPDIWAVPGNDPNGAPGTPQVGQGAFVWARVRNEGRSELADVQVRFYWSNPATGVLRSNSTLIGSSFATLAPGSDVEVLCLTPWLPSGANDGHVCLVAEAIHPAFPLPQPLPDAFSPPTYDQVAQRNIDLLPMAAGMIRMMAIQVAAPRRVAMRTVVAVERREKPLPDEVARSLGLGERRFTADLPIEAGLLERPEIDCGSFRPQPELKRATPPGGVGVVWLAVRAEKLDRDAYGILDVVERDGETGALVGGVTFVIVAAEA